MLSRREMGKMYYQCQQKIELNRDLWLDEANQDRFLSADMFLQEQLISS